MNKELNKLKGYIKHKDLINLDVSKSDVAWHIDHSLKVINGVISSLINSDENDYSKNFNFLRVLLFSLNFLPRGRAKSPKRVLPPEIISEKDLIKQLENAYLNLNLINNLKKNKNFNHHVFGMLNKKQTLKFVKIHTNHHLKIIKDIIVKT